MLPVFLLQAFVGVAEGLSCAFVLCGVLARPEPGIPDGARDAWLALLHYWDESGAWVSDVRDTTFFLHPEGSRNPEQEWAASRRGFLAAPEPGEFGEHAQCRFPARFALMKRALEWSDNDVPRVECVEFVAHQRKLSARTLSVVFVSHYVDNPASAFGHAMLYIGSESARSAVLADYSVSFEADTDGMSPLQYLPRGLFGGLVAGFRLAPLHERVRKYERQEQRDLWLFPLRLSHGEIDQLVRHLWELKEVKYRYGFFGGNCAQKLLALVHAVAPTYRVLPYRTPAVLPAEVSRRLVDRIGLAGNPVHRPSLQKQYNRLLAGLDPAEREKLETIVASRTVVQNASADILSAALLRSEFETPYRAFRRAVETEDHDDLVWRRALWSARVAGAGAGMEESRGAVRDPGPSLLEGHRPSRFMLAGGYRDGTGSILAAGARWLLHGAVDPHIGYPPVSSLEVGRFEVGLSSSGDPFIDEVTAIRVERLAPASELQSALAWKLELGARRLAYDGESPLHFGMEFGIGVGAALLRSDYTVAAYSMVGARPGGVLSSRGNAFLIAGIWSGGFVMRLPGDVRARFSGEYPLSLSSLRGSGAAFKVVVRKGLIRDLDVELAAAHSPNRSGITVGLVTFR